MRTQAEKMQRRLELTPVRAPRIRKKREEYKKAYGQIRQVLDRAPFIADRLLVECWNDPMPHWGGTGAHHYPGTTDICSLCCRPRDWEPLDAGRISLEGFVQ